MCPIDAKKRVPEADDEGSRSTFVVILFFEGVSPVWGRWAKVQQGTPYSLGECNKALLPKPHTGAGLSACSPRHG